MNTHQCLVLRVAVCLLATCLLADPTTAIQFVFDYSGDSPGEGFNDPVLGPARRAAMQFAGDTWGELIRPAYVGEFVMVTAVYDPAANMALTPLASAAPTGYVSNFGSSSPQYSQDTHYPQALANHLFGGDSAPNSPDIRISVNTKITNFYLGTDGNPASTQYDLVSVLLHELGHGLGFDASFRQDGSYGVTAERTFFPDVEFSGFATIYDRFVSVGPSTLMINLDRPSRVFGAVSNNLFWSGVGGIQGNAGVQPRLNAPFPYDNGSSISHVDQTVHGADLMSPSLATGATMLTPSGIDRGMLRDMGWTISVATSGATWTGAGPNNAASTAANWSLGLPLPGDNLLFGASPQTNVNFDLQLESIGSLVFNAGAPSHTLTLRGWSDLNVRGAGVLNGSANPQTIELESGLDTSVLFPFVAGARLAFSDSANAGAVDYLVRGGSSMAQSSPGGQTYYDRFAGARVEFRDTADAGHGTFVVQGAVGNGAPDTHGAVDFRNGSTAGRAQFRNEGGRIGGDHGGVSIGGWGGQTNFYDNSTAFFAQFINDGEVEYRGGTGGITTFYDNAAANDATFVNNGAAVSNGNGGRTQFTGNSSANGSTIANNGGAAATAGGGQTLFTGDASAGSAAITNNPANVSGALGGRTVFSGNSSANHATITNAPRSNTFGSTSATTEFYDSSTADHATIVNAWSQFGPSVTTFYQNASAADGVFINENGPTGVGGQFVFKGSASAGRGVFTNGASGGAVIFNDSSTASEARIVLRGKSNSTVQFSGNSSAGAAMIDIGPEAFSQFNETSQAQFLGSSSAAQATITVRGGGGSVSFAGIGGPSAPSPTTTAASAFIEVFGATGTQNTAGTALFSSASTAGNATIVAHGSNVLGITGGGAVVTFANGGRAGAATLTANGGATPTAGAVVRFQQGGMGDAARLVINSGASADFSLNLASGTSVGSIEGDGRFSLGGSLLTVGNLGASSLVSGSISDSGGLTQNTGGRLTKVGAGTLTLGGVNTYSGLTTINAGAIALTGSLTGGVTVNSGGTLKGTGAIGGVVTVNPGGLLSPGLSPGTLTVGGLNLMSGSELRYELGAERDHIVLTGSGAVTLGGTLTVSLLAGFVPTLGESIPLFEGAVGSILGAFENVFVPTFNGLTLSVSQTASTVSLQVGEAPPLPGDYNGDGAVDAADYTRWRDNLGSAVTLLNDDTPGVGADDYDRWKNHFGAAALGALHDKAAALAVPEPRAAFLLLIALATFAWRVGDPRLRGRFRADGLADNE